MGSPVPACYRDYATAYQRWMSALSPLDKARARQFAKWLGGLDEAGRNAAVAIALGVGTEAAPRDEGEYWRGVSQSLDSRGITEGHDDDLSRRDGENDAISIAPAGDDAAKLEMAGALLARIFAYIVHVPITRFRRGALGHNGHAAGTELLLAVGLRALVVVNLVNPGLAGAMTNAQVATLNGTTRQNINKLQSEFRDSCGGFQARNTESPTTRKKCQQNQLA